MHARVMTYPIRGDNFDRVIQVVQQRILPAARRQPGFGALVLMSNREEGKIVTNTYWNTEADMHASEEAGYLQEQISWLISLLQGPPTIEHYEVDVIS